MFVIIMSHFDMSLSIITSYNFSYVEADHLSSKLLTYFGQKASIASLINNMIVSVRCILYNSITTRNGMLSYLSLLAVFSLFEILGLFWQYRFTMV